ncbi:acylphosphatase-2-like isoform X1 [Poecilia reticulata]|uniref:acylphosphatase-2-like isoform X1 n=1 Tax=Poecilia reticulata TaxID=8081 RepID=UPI0004A2905A|nr:PREDICTED: acylphosphatase-2-like isoform X1 [Poecilia reticulata]
MSAESGLESVDFEVFGHVQGVCFRMLLIRPDLQSFLSSCRRRPSASETALLRLSVWTETSSSSCLHFKVRETSPVLQHTEKEGLRLVGWVKNTSSGTVVGQAQGPAAMVEEM